MVLASHKESHPATVFNYLYATISLAILLYLLGALGVLVVYSNNAITYVRENIPFYVELSDSATDAEVFKFQELLESSAYSKPGSVKFVSKAEAMKEMTADGSITEEDIMLFGENLLPNAITFKLKSDYVADFDSIEKEITAHKFVTNVAHPEEMLPPASTNLRRLEIITLILVIFFIFVAITLIKNTLKLSILANKNTIKILQISGATKDYLTKPYLKRSIWNGLICAGIAIIALILTIFLLQSQIKDISEFANWGSFFAIFLGLSGVGVLTFWGSAQHSIRKYFSMPIEKWS